MVGQLSVVKGAGEMGGEEDYGGNGSIRWSISNEGKNWSKSSRWKSCSAWGGSSSLPVSRVSGLWCFFGQWRPKRLSYDITPDVIYPNIYICDISCIFEHSHDLVSHFIKKKYSKKIRNIMTIYLMTNLALPSFIKPQLPKGCIQHTRSPLFIQTRCAFTLA